MPTARLTRRLHATMCARSSPSSESMSPQIEGRVAALSEAELAMLADQIGQAPAGGDALAVIGIVFVVLIILELTGVIDIFKKT